MRQNLLTEVARPQEPVPAVSFHLHLRHKRRNKRVLTVLFSGSSTRVPSDATEQRARNA